MTNRLYCTLTCLTFLSIAAVCPAQDPNHEQTIDELLVRLTHEDSAAQASSSLWQHGSDPRTIPALRSAFLNSATKEVKQSIAIVMMRLNTEDPAYYDYLASFVSEAVRENPPSLTVLKPNGDLDFSRPNPDFEEWCHSRGKNVTDEAEKQFRIYPEDISVLSLFRDKRAGPIFRKGVSSNNPMIAFECALSLAAIGDSNDIEFLIEAATRSTEMVEYQIARGLATYYNNPRDRAVIVKRVQGSRLYEPYLKAVAAADSERAAAARRPNGQ